MKTEEGQRSLTKGPLEKESLSDVRLADPITTAAEAGQPFADIHSVHGHEWP